MGKVMKAKTPQRIPKWQRKKENEGKERKKEERKAGRSNYINELTWAGEVSQGAHKVVGC